MQKQQTTPTQVKNFAIKNKIAAFSAKISRQSILINYFNTVKIDMLFSNTVAFS